MGKVSLIEQETVIVYNQAEKTAQVFTYNPTLQRKLAEYEKDNPEVRLIRKGSGYKEYEVPKKWIKVAPPRKVSESQKKAAAERMTKMQAAKKK